MIPFRVVFLTFSRAAAASSVLGISVTTCLTKFLVWISTRFELLRIPITLLTDYSLSDSDNWPDPSFHFFRQIDTFLFRQRSTHLPRSMIFIISIISYQCCNLRLFTPKSFAESRQAARRAGYSPGWGAYWWYSLPVSWFEILIAF